MINAITSLRLKLDGLRRRAVSWLRRQRRKLPYIVWYGQEVDVRLLFPNDVAYLEWLTEAEPLPENGVKLKIKKKKVKPLSPVQTAAGALKEAGISFISVWPYDKKLRGAEWLLGPSLRGPMRIKFEGTTKNLLARTE